MILNRSDDRPLSRSLASPLSQKRISVLSEFFFDSSAGGLFTALDAPVDASLTVSAGSVAFSSGTTKDLKLVLKDGTSAQAQMCFDDMTIEAVFTLNSLPAAGAVGARVGTWQTSSGLKFAGELLADSGAATSVDPGLMLNDVSLVSASPSVAFASGSTVRMVYRRQGAQASVQYTVVSTSGALAANMVFAATSYQLPQRFSRAMVQFVSGTMTLTGLKISALYKGVGVAFMGDSITQGQNATAYADGYAQLIRSDRPSDVLVAGAPSATITAWRDATWAFIRMAPRRAFILLGTNDIANGRTDLEIQADYTALINALISAGITPIAVSILPRGSARVPTINAWIAAQGWRYINAYTALVGTGTSLAPAFDSGDGLHLSTAGHLALANVIRAYINNGFSNVPVGVPVMVGDPYVGNPLSISTAGISDPDGIASAITTQVTRNGTPISGATGSTYAAVLADVGATLRVVATFTDNFGKIESVISPAVGPVTLTPSTWTGQDAAGTTYTGDLTAYDAAGTAYTLDLVAYDAAGTSYTLN